MKRLTAGQWITRVLVLAVLVPVLARVLIVLFALASL